MSVFLLLTLLTDALKQQLTYNAFLTYDYNYKHIVWESD